MDLLYPFPYSRYNYRRRRAGSRQEQYGQVNVCLWPVGTLTFYPTFYLDIPLHNCTPHSLLHIFHSFNIWTTSY